MNTRSVAWGSVVPLATLLLLALIAAGPLWGPGLLNTRGGGDSPFLLLRTHQLAANLRAGIFPVRWMPDAAYGLGYPFFSYYAALPYYLVAGFTLTLAPFHLVNVYVRGDSLSEFAAFAFYPLILWGLDCLAARPSLRRALLPALAYAGLTLTHNTSALIFSPFILLYIAFHVSRFMSLSHCSLFIASLFLGLALSAWFWLPALAETGYVQLTAQTSGYFFYGNHFRGADLVQPNFIFDYAITPGGPTPFAMGLVQAILTPLSRPLWDHLPLLPMVQFPWRFLSVQALFTALLTGALVPFTFTSMGGKEGKRGWVAATVLAGLLAVAGLAGLQPEYLPITAEDVTVERLQLYELFTGNGGRGGRCRGGLPGLLLARLAGDGGRRACRGGARTRFGLPHAGCSRRATYGRDVVGPHATAGRR